MENNTIKYKNYYTGEEKETKLPNDTKYNFLLERNNKYMNYTALSFGKKKITYEEMHEKIELYAKSLHKYGIHKGDKVAVCVVNTIESIYLLYALDKIGATVIGLSPLNNEYKMKRDLEMTNPKFVITVDMMYSKIKSSENLLDFSTIIYSPIESLNNPFLKTVYNVKQIHDKNRTFFSNNELKKIIKTGENSVYNPCGYDKGFVSDIMFTGGSSGIHKGVQLNGNGLNCVVKALDDVLLLEPGMTHLGNIPFGHMAFGRLVLHYALCNNLEYALTLKMLPNDFYDEMVRTEAHGAMGGPIHWESLINNSNIKKGSLSNLIQPLSGGELFKPEKRKMANEVLKNAGCNYVIGDGLGLTEMWAPTHVCVGGKNTPGTIGYPIPFVNTKIVNPYDFSEVEPGETGLLLVNGPGMMIGYHNNDEENKKVFITDENNTKWYNTGDLAKQSLEVSNEYIYIGRKKRNFVCGVDNIYPEQIESLLLELPEIREVVITKIPDEEKQYLPKYHISLNSEVCDTKSLELKIEKLISNTLGESALPGYIEYSYKPLPRTDNGKLNATLLETMDLEKFNSNKLIKLKK